MNIQESIVMQKLDATVMAGSTGIIKTQFGDVRVHPTRFHGYAAELVNANGQKVVEFGHSPSNAFWKLGGTVKAMAV